jgi:hypothetical protein
MEDSVPVMSLESKVDRLLSLEPKINQILKLQQAQQSRARWAVVWKIVLIFMFVVLPTYLSYKAFSSFDFSSILGNLSKIGELSNSNEASPIFDMIKTLK